MMMKTVKILLVGMLLFGAVHGVEAQFLNRLKNRIVEEAEKVVIDKAADKAAEKTSEAMDHVLSPDISLDNILSGIGNTVDLNQLPETYRFDYIYGLKMENPDGSFLFDYLLNKTEPYMGLKPNVGNNADLVVVIDDGSKAFVTVTGGQVFAMSMSEDNADQAEDEAIKELEANVDYKITNLPNRTFLGYDCVGYRMVGEDHSMIVYIAPDLEVGFGNMFNAKQSDANVPSQMKSLNRHFNDGLLMYMELENENTVMECVVLERKSTEIRVR